MALEKGSGGEINTKAPDIGGVGKDTKPETQKKEASNLDASTTIGNQLDSKNLDQEKKPQGDEGDKKLDPKNLDLEKKPQGDEGDKKLDPKNLDLEKKPQGDEGDKKLDPKNLDLEKKPQGDEGDKKLDSKNLDLEKKPQGDEGDKKLDPKNLDLEKKPQGDEGDKKLDPKNLDLEKNPQENKNLEPSSLGEEKKPQVLEEDKQLNPSRQDLGDSALKETPVENTKKPEQGNEVSKNPRELASENEKAEPRMEKEHGIAPVDQNGESAGAPADREAEKTPKETFKDELRDALGAAANAAKCVGLGALGMGKMAAGNWAGGLCDIGKAAKTAGDYLGPRVRDVMGKNETPENVQGKETPGQTIRGALDATGHASGFVLNMTDGFNKVMSGSPLDMLKGANKIMDTMKSAGDYLGPRIEDGVNTRKNNG